MMQRLSRLIALALLIASTSALTMQLYKWEDESGNVYYGQVKPANAKAIQLDEPPPPPSLAPDVGNPQQQLEESLKQREMKQQLQQQAQQQVKQAEYDEQQCLQARENLYKMQTWRRARSASADGTPTMLSEEEKQARIQEAQQTVAEFCK